MKTRWGGCRLAANHADFWHAAKDFASQTLCGITLTPATGIAEHRVTANMTECRACQNAH